jgi:hypothetical protein
LAEIFGVAIVEQDDPDARINFVITTGAATPTLTPPPRP